MRILHALRTVNPAAGGPVEVVVQTSKILARDGHSCETISLDSPNDSFISKFPIPLATAGPSSLGQFGYSRALLPWLRQNSRNYDVVLVHGIWDYHALGVWRALRKSRQPYFVFPHGMLDPWFKRTYPLKHLKKWLYWPWAAYRMLRDACGVLFTAEEERELARQSFWLYRCREFVVNYGTSPYEGDGEAHRTEFLEHFPSLQNKRILLFLGRIHIKKGCDLLIQAFAHSASKDESLHLVVAGPDQCGERERLEKLSRDLGIERRITWTGMLSGNLKWGAMHAAEAFVLPSHQENFGIAVTEALACGTPVLTTNKVNIWREIQACNGGIVENDNLLGTIRLLNRWFDLSERSRQQMRDNAKRCFHQHFDIHKTASILIDTLRANGVKG